MPLSNQVFFVIVEGGRVLELIRLVKGVKSTLFDVQIDLAICRLGRSCCLPELVEVVLGDPLRLFRHHAPRLQLQASLARLA